MPKKHISFTKVAPFVYFAWISKKLSLEINFKTFKKAYFDHDLGFFSHLLKLEISPKFDAKIKESFVLEIKGL